MAISMPPHVTKDKKKAPHKNHSCRVEQFSVIFYLSYFQKNPFLVPSLGFHGVVNAVSSQQEGI